MERGPRTRLALAAALLFAQLALPAGHDLAVAAADHPLLSAAAALSVDAPWGGSQRAAHDPRLCPLCLALGQARSGVARTAPVCAVSGAVVTAPLVREPCVAPPATPELASAPPRAPPVRARFPA